MQSARLMAAVPVVHHWPSRGAAVPARPPAAAKEEIHSRIIGVAASTGGPSALAHILKPLPPSFPAPILVVQHITEGFAPALAAWLDGETALKVVVARQGERPTAGGVWLAPDDYHLQISRAGVIELQQGAPYKGLRPSANHLFRSLAAVYGRRALGIVLTGMGDDGAEGLSVLRQAGGLAIAQDEESCVVYGMPREAVSRRAVDRVLSLDQIAALLAGGLS